MDKQEFLSEERIAISNRKARHDYEIIDVYEAGIVLKGPEVKSLRMGRANLQDSYADLKQGEVWLHNMHISPFEQANRFNHDPVRTRKLLLNKSEIRKLIGKTTEKGLTLIPLKVYFKKGKAKVELALAKGKKEYDRREDIKKREMDRELRRTFRKN
ncbi:MAG: SsrA-binding protein SmpB [Ignavibacteriales bacterium]|nr:SsrA-binding protein SmpB [Ignavibacteriales bacterium]